MDDDPFCFVTPFDRTFEGDTGPQIDDYALISRKDHEDGELYSYLGKDKHYLFENTPFEKFDFCYRSANKNFIIIGKYGLSNAFNMNEKPYKLVSDEWVLYDKISSLMRNKAS